jgi:hypothetical protein
MKKLLILLVLLSFKLTAQQNETRETVATGSFWFGGPEWQFKKVTKGDNSYNYFYVSFKDMKYSALNQYKSIHIYNESKLRLFAEKLIEFGSMKEKKDISFSQNEFNIRIYNWTKLIYLENEDGYYTTIPRKTAIKQGQILLDFLVLNPGFLTK